MSVYYSELKICNLALVEIGETPIQSLDENSKKARHLKILFPLKRDELLRSHPWHFAKERVALVADVEVPIFGFAKQFLLPANTLKIISIDCDRRYAREGNKILTDSESVNLLHIFRNTDPDTWDPSVVTVMAKLLAIDLAFSLKGSRTLRTDFRDEYTAALALAMYNSAYDSTPTNDMEYEGEGRLVSARNTRIDRY